MRIGESCDHKAGNDEAGMPQYGVPIPYSQRPSTDSHQKPTWVGAWRGLMAVSAMLLFRIKCWHNKSLLLLHQAANSVQPHSSLS